MGWAKYDEDNRDFIEERWAQRGAYTTSVFNYTCDGSTSRKNGSYAYVGRNSAYGTANAYMSRSAESRRK